MTVLRSGEGKGRASRRRSRPPRASPGVPGRRGEAAGTGGRAPPEPRREGQEKDAPLVVQPASAGQRRVGLIARSAGAGGRGRCARARGLRRPGSRCPSKRASAFLMRTASTSSRLISSSRRPAAVGSLQAEVGGLDSRPAGHQHRPLDRVVELAHVAGPGVLREGAQAAASKPVDALSVPRGSAGSRKCAARAGMSSRRSRSGGTRISMVFRRKSRSWRKRPAATSAAGRRSWRRGSARRPGASARSRRARTRRSRAPAGASPAGSGGTLAISSRKSVPPSASSKRPTRSAFASVNAPLTWPNSSLSKTPSERPPAFTVTSGPAGARRRRVEGLGHRALARAVLARDQDVGVGRAHAFDQLEHRAHGGSLGDERHAGSLVAQQPGSRPRGAGPGAAPGRARPGS